MEQQFASCAVNPLSGYAYAAASAEFRPFLTAETAAPTHPSDGVGFAVFRLATLALICRPSELFPSLLQYIPIYEVLMIACLSLSVPRLLYQVSSQRLAARAMTLLILGICPAIMLSHLARGSIYDARVDGGEFFKICLYYLLLLAWVDSPRRMRKFLLWLLACSMALIICALLELNGKIDIPALRAIRQGYTDPMSGDGSVLVRLCGIGIFHDPNDLCLVLVVAIALCLYFVGDRKIGVLRLGWVFPVSLFGYAVQLTYSRGGLLALLSGLGAVLTTRYGWRRAVFAGVLVLPIMLVIFGGRQTQVDFSDPDDTFQTRLDRWSDSLTLFQGSPIWGCGEGQQGELRGQVAHNSFIQSFAELGLLGGGCFLGAFLIAIGGIYRKPPPGTDPQLVRLRPYLMGAVAGYAATLLSLTRTYSVPTYLVLGLAGAYINLAPPPASMILRVNGRLFRRVGMASLIFIAITYVFIRVMSSVSGS